MLNKVALIRTFLKLFTLKMWNLTNIRDGNDDKIINTYEQESIPFNIITAINYKNINLVYEKISTINQVYHDCMPAGSPPVNRLS